MCLNCFGVINTTTAITKNLIFEEVLLVTKGRLTIYLNCAASNHVQKEFSPHWNSCEF